MKQCLNRFIQCCVAILVAITLLPIIALPASAITILPGEEFIGPSCPQFEVVVRDCRPFDVGKYAFEMVDGAIITNRNSVPCAPGAIDSYFPRQGDQIKVTNQGKIPIELHPVCD